MSMTLYEVSEHLIALLDSEDMCESDEERAQCQAEIYRTLEASVRKVDDFCRYLAHLDSQVALAGDEIERLKDRKATLENTAHRLEQYAIRVMESLDVRRLDGRTSRLWLRIHQPAVVVESTDLVPYEFKAIKTEISVDKRAIKKAIDAGVEVPGAHLGTPSVSLIRS